MLTKTLLQHLATGSSFSRGESYFDNDSVRKINRNANTFTAKVDGSQRYTVSLTLNATGPDFTCSCPYELVGICKHSVALGLAVLDEFGPELARSSADDAGIQWFSPTGEPAAGNDLWQRVSDDDKLRFLAQLLDKKPELKTQLALFAGVVTPVPVGKPDKTLSADVICSEVCEQLTDLRFDDDSLDFDQDDWYSEESPDPTPLIADVLQPYAEKVVIALREGRLTDAITLYMGVYEGTQAATEPDSDEYSIIDNYPGQAWEVWHELLLTIYAEMALRVFSTDQLRQALQQLADRIRAFEELEDDEDPDDDDYVEALYGYNLKAFEPLLIALVTEETSAQVMHEAITQNGWQGFGTEYVQLHIANKRKDPEAWLKIAGQFAPTDLTIGLQLLDKLRQMGDKPTLITQLHRLSKPFAGQLDKFILEHLSITDLQPGRDQKLYLDALATRCRRLGQLPDYLLLREYYTPDKRRAFANELASSYNSLFYLQVLHTEGRMDELLPVVEKMAWHHARSMPDILALVAPLYPTDCMALTRKKAFSSLETGKRDRGLYALIASWVAALHNITELRTQAVTLAGTLISSNPRLSALRDELRQKGLVR